MEKEGIYQPNIIAETESSNGDGRRLCLSHKGSSFQRRKSGSDTGYHPREQRIKRQNLYVHNTKLERRG